ncbi:MAG: MFS transporter [Paludibacteraceae bacterium]|nr:MFS transporter [Paludibacteraceae bacterium]
MLKIQEKRNNAFFAMLSLPATAMGFALSVQISALSWILSTKYGLDIHEIGIVWAAGPIAGIIAQPIVGAISDKLWFMGGRRRPWIIIGGILTGLMLLALPNLDIVQKILMGDNATEGLLAIAVAVALTLDLSINVSFNPTRSLVADCTTKDERSKGYTWMQTVSGTFGVLAYLIAVIFNNEVLIYVGIFIALFFTIIPSLLIVEPRELEKENEEIVAGSDKKSNSIKEMILSLVPLAGFLIYGIYVIIAKLFGFEDTSSLTFFGSITLSSVEFICIIIEILAIIAVLLNITKQSKNNNEFQKILMAHSFTWWGVQTMNIYMFFYISTKISGLSAEAMASTNSWAFLVRDLVGAILPVLVLNVIAKKTGMTRTHTFSILLMALGYAIIALFGSNIIVFFAALLLVGIGWASLVSLPFAIMSEKVDQSKMGLYMGIFNLSVVLPQLVASFKMGEVINNAQDKSIIFVICAVCLAISGILWFSVKNDKVK